MKQQPQKQFSGKSILKDGTVIEDEDWAKWCEANLLPEEISNFVLKIFLNNAINKASVTNPEKVLTEAKQIID